MSTSTDDEATVRIGRASVPGPGLRNQAEDKPPQRRRIEIASPLFGAFAAGMLLVASGWILWDGAGTTAQKSTVVWQALALTALAALCIGLLRLAARTRELNSCIRELRSQVAGLNLIVNRSVFATEASAQQVMSLLRAVAFSVGEDRSEGNEHRARVVELWSEVLEHLRSDNASGLEALAAELGVLRGLVEKMGDRQESLAQDFALAQVLAVRDRKGVPVPRGDVIRLQPRDVDHS